jgi:capsular exopolysaccharide synthesis family protein
MTVSSIFSIVRRRLLPLLLCLIAGIGGGLWHGHSQSKVYQSSARVFMNIPTAQTTLEALQGVQLSGQLLDSYANIVTSRTAAEQVRNQLGWTDSVGSILHRLSAATEPNTLIITITAKDHDPARAAALAEASANVLNSTVASLETNRDAASAVQARIIDHAVLPTTPVSPRPTRDLILGLILGLLAGIALAAALDALDRSIKLPSEADALLGAPGLGGVPKFRSGRVPVLAGEKGGAAAEAYRSIRTAVRYINVDEPPRTLVISSPRDGEGKTTTAINLALALAQSGERVVLVDADLRGPSVAKKLRRKAELGLTDILTGGTTTDKALCTYRPQLDVLFSGPTPPNPSELLGSQRMAAVIEQLANEYDYVIFDAPPVLQVTDAVVLSTQVDGTMMVLRHGRTNRAAAAEAARRLGAVDANVIGYVFNALAGREPEAYYSNYGATEVISRQLQEA